MADGGPKNTKAIVLSNNLEMKQFGEKDTIKNISSYHSMVPETDGIRHYEYYSIGKGKLITYRDTEFVPNIK